MYRNVISKVMNHIGFQIPELALRSSLSVDLLTVMAKSLDVEN